MNYKQFLHNKRLSHKPNGFQPSELPASLFEWQAKKLGKRYDFDAVMGMGRNKVRGMIASLQGQLKKREAVA